MKSVKLQLLVTLVAVAVAAGFFICRGLPPETMLHDAAYYGDAEQALRNIAWGVDADCAWPVEVDGDDLTLAITPLWQAWDGAELEMMELLHQQGARDYGIRWHERRNWEQLLPPGLRRQGLVFPDLVYGSSVWSRPGALQVIGWLSEREVAVVSVDVFRKRASRVFEPVDDEGVRWLAGERSPGEAWAAFVKRTNSLAATYIRSFAWSEKETEHGGREPYFALLVISRREYESPAADEEGAE